MNHDWCNGRCEDCPEDPRLMVGEAIGMYHCPYCAMMLLAGSAHATCAELDTALDNAADVDLLDGEYNDCF